LKRISKERDSSFVLFFFLGQKIKLKEGEGEGKHISPQSEKKWLLK